jgi:hypothetical protein
MLSIFAKTNSFLQKVPSRDEQIDLKGSLLDSNTMRACKVAKTHDNFNQIMRSTPELEEKTHHATEPKLKKPISMFNKTASMIKRNDQEDNVSLLKRESHGSLLKSQSQSSVRVSRVFSRKNTPSYKGNLAKIGYLGIGSTVLSTFDPESETPNVCLSVKKGIGDPEKPKKNSFEAKKPEVTKVNEFDKDKETREIPRPKMKPILGGQIKKRRQEDSKFHIRSMKKKNEEMNSKFFVCR